MTSAIEELIQKSAREDGFRFLKIRDLSWKDLASDIELFPVESMQAPFAGFENDPFAEMARRTGRQLETRIAPGIEKNWLQVVGPEANRFSVLNQRVVLSEGSSLEWVFAHHQATELFSRIDVVLEKNARLKLILIQSEVQKSQIRARIQFEGSGAEVDVRGLVVGKGEERQDLWVEIEHRVPHTKSQFVSDAIVRDRAHAIFNGAVTIGQNGAHTEAHQKNKSMILNSGASVDSFPKLWIGNDEVKCSHGSSVATLEPEALMYLQSRGISRAEAEVMMLNGMIRQTINAIQNGDHRAKVNVLLNGSENDGLENDHE